MVRINGTGIKLQIMIESKTRVILGENNMKKISYFGVLVVLLGVMPAYAKDKDTQFRAEVLEGLDLVSARLNVDVIPDDAPGELGAEVYQTEGSAYTDGMRVFVPTSMYVRGGGGLNLGFATSKAKYNGNKYESSGSWTTFMGLGWNLSSFVRAEIDFQTTTLEFSDLDMGPAEYQNLTGMLYFDLVRRYVQTGDITYRRVFVPFIGMGAGVGHYLFNGAEGANGFAVSASTASAGFSIMLNDLINLDIMYQYQMMIGQGFGWGINSDSVSSISNITASFRVNF